MSHASYGLGGRNALLEGLNPSQQEAVTHGGGPLLVVAGAGSGKTRVLTRRVAWLVAGGLPGRAVLAITFTNKAAGVLRDRLVSLPGAAAVWAGTFHGFGAWMLRQHGDRIGIAPEFTILDREDQRRLLKALISDNGLDPKRMKPADVGAMLSHAKNGGVGPRPMDLSHPDDEAAFALIARTYASRLRAANLLDFDDLLLEPLRLLESDEGTREHYARRFAHVLVDEYQDTNLVQARMLRALLGPARNLTVVGDPDQSIYRWRGAVVRNILEFEKDFPGARTVLLEQNYRSTARILDAAEHVIAKNVERHAKRLFTEKSEGAAVVEVICRDADDEAEALVGLVREWRRDGYALGDIAVFYRVNAHSRSLELALRGQSIPYVVVAGVEFFQRREVKDLLAYARLVENPGDDAAFLRIANVPRRGVGNVSLKKIRMAAAERGVPCLSALRDGVPGLSNKAKKGLLDLLLLIDTARSRPTAPVGPLLQLLAEQSGYRVWLEEQEAADTIGRARVENIDELIAFAHEQDAADPAIGLVGFLERTALVADQDGYEEGDGRITLMSVHAAKGLEFPCVIVAGAEDEYFPHGRSAMEEGGLEEERRLFYVAMTRAMERLALTWAGRRMSYRGLEHRLPSPFIADIPEALRERRVRHTPPPSMLRDAAPRDPWPAPALEEAIVREVDAPFVVGERVAHPYFGEGTLQDLQGQGENMRVTVQFLAHGTKRLLLRHARLERMP